jgi:pyruvate dehydrogenase E2 component (dihydrolipoamide acetyltransferase)
MADAILLPKLSDTMTVGVLAGWNVKVGDAVSAGDVICEIETDKATMEYESPFDGTVLYTTGKAGDEIAIGALIAVVGKPGEDFSALLAQHAGAAATAQPAAATEGAPPTPQTPTSQPTAPAAPQAATEEGRLKSSPLARTMAKELGLELAQLQGSGEGGRIVKRDVEAALSHPATPATPAANTPTPAVQATPAPTPVPPPAGGYEDVRVSQMRQAIARRLSESKFTAPHFYLTVSVDMDQAVAFRKQVNDDLARSKSDVKVSFNDIVIKAVAAALRRHPKVNSSWLGDTIRTYHYVNIGVAVAVDEGLVVPVLRSADTLGLSDINTQVRDYAARARERKLKPEEMAGNTFTISNLGMFGIEEFTAIINPPDACILAVGAITQQPVVREGAIVVGNVMKMTLSCDHRVVDGAVGSAFLQTLVHLLENPVRMLV